MNEHNYAKFEQEKKGRRQVITNFAIQEAIIII